MRMPALAALALAAFSLHVFVSCDESRFPTAELSEPSAACSVEMTPSGIARMLSDLPLTIDEVCEVWQGVSESSSMGYDEEYAFATAIETRSDGPSLGRLISEYFETQNTRASGFVEELVNSGLQIYWPYSEDWDGQAMPVITFDPAADVKYNTGYFRERLPDGKWIVKEMQVDEGYSMKNPVWIVNHNQDSGSLTPQLLEKMARRDTTTRASAPSDFRTLRLKEFKAHRQYDSFWNGASEFLIKSGSIRAFTADVISDLSRFSPEITDMVIVVKRKQVGKVLRYNTIIVPEWSSQLQEPVFLMLEDDGGKMTSWKSSGAVKIKSKSYGFEVEIPYHRNDDIVWRGKLSGNYFEKNDGIANRYGDVSIAFTFD